MKKRPWTIVRIADGFYAVPGDVHPPLVEGHGGWYVDFIQLACDQGGGSGDGVTGVYLCGRAATDGLPELRQLEVGECMVFDLVPR